MAKKASVNDYVFTSDNATIVTMIKKFAEGNAKMHLAVHSIAVSCILHAVEFGQVGPVNNFLKSFDLGGKAKMNGWRMGDLKAWFERTGPFVWFVDKEKKIAELRLKKEQRNELLALGMPAVIAKFSTVKTFWEAKPEPDYKGFDIVARAAALYREAMSTMADEKKMESGKVKIDPAFLDNLGRLLNMGKPEADVDDASIKLIAA